ncbi:MAG: GrpB family protein [Planctomycetaceae bacterium]
MPSKYTFTDYSPDWPEAFRREEGLLRALLGDVIVTVHHIGSTSVPGLAAKPIIDLLPVVRDIRQVDAATSALTETGYRSWGEYGLAGRRFFTKDHQGHRTHNIHMYQTGNPSIERHLAFCALLREDLELQREYVRIKREAYARFPSDINAYNDAKDAWIKQVEEKAIQWYRQQLTARHN